MVRRTRVHRMSDLRKKRKLTPAEQARLDTALVRLVGSTRRLRRVKNLLEVAIELEVAEKLLGGREAVAKEIGLSEEMLREFASVTNLHKSVKQMVKAGLVTSVDTAYRISILPKSEQLQVARGYVKNELSGKEVRDVIALRKRNPGCDLGEIIESVKRDRDIIQYVIKFRLNVKKGIRVLRQRFSQIIGKENIISLETDGRIAKLILSEKGRRILQEEAKKRKMTKRKLIQLIVDRE